MKKCLVRRLPLSSIVYAKENKTGFFTFYNRTIFMNIRTVFYMTILGLSLASCTKTLTELPPATQTGANTFGAKVDGKLWAPAGFGAFPANDILEAHFAVSDLIINARNFSSSPTETEFEIQIKNFTGAGTYPLNVNAGYPDYNNSYGYYVLRRINPINEWITSSQYGGSVTITKIDSVNHFVSGTFEFQAINLYNTPQPINVT